MKGGRDGVWFWSKLWSKPTNLIGDFLFLFRFCDFLKRIRKNCNIFCQNEGSAGAKGKLTKIHPLVPFMAGEFVPMYLKILDTL